MEPAPVLVGAFEVDVGDAVFGAVFPVTQDKGVGGAGIEPDVEDVEDLVVILVVYVIAEEALLGAVLVPGVGAFGLERFEDALR